MKDVDQLLRDLAEGASGEAVPVLDVRERVMRTVASMQPTVRLDLSPVVFGGISVAVAASVVVAFAPIWQVMFDPWITYFYL